MIKTTENNSQTQEKAIRAIMKKPPLTAKKIAFGFGLTPQNTTLVGVHKLDKDKPFGFCMISKINKSYLKDNNGCIKLI